MADVTNEYERNSLLSPALDAPAEYNSNNGDSSSNVDGAAAASSDDDSTAQDNFGDLLAQLLRSLPTDASTLFIQSLSGLSTRESGELCTYVAQLKAEKQYRVIRAMADSKLDGKKKFLDNLRRKFALQREKEQALQAQGERELEEHMKRKQALSAAARVKMLNGGAKQFHSMNAVLGAKENVASGNNVGLTAAALAARDVPTGVARSLSSSSVTITKEDIRSVGQLLGDAHIGESEQNLRELEISKFTASSGPSTSSTDTAMDAFAKRERPESSRALTSTEEKALQRTRSADERAPLSSTLANGGNDSPSDSVDGDGDDTASVSTTAANDNDNNPDAPTTKRWTKSQDAALRESVRIHGEKNWKAIAELVPGRNHAQCLQRWRKVLKPGLVKGHWSFEEDQVLEFLVTQGCNNWGQIAERIPGRTPKQCRERWKNHLDPAINKGPYTEDEDAVILAAQDRLGNKWSQIAQLLKGRTEDSVKIRWKSLKQNPTKAALTHAQLKKHAPSTPTLSPDQLYASYQQQYGAAPAPVSGGQYADEYAASPVGYSAGASSFRFSHALNGNTNSSSSNAGPYSARHDHVAVAHEHMHSPVRDSVRDPHSNSNDSWDLQSDLTDSLGLHSRLGENPPPSSFWETTYPKHGGQIGNAGGDPIPLALHVSDDAAFDFTF